MGWVSEELASIDLGDTRRSRRAIHLIERLPEHPTASIPGACNGWAETQAAYRFLASDTSIYLCRIVSASRDAWRPPSGGSP